MVEQLVYPKAGEDLLGHLADLGLQDAPPLPGNAAVAASDVTRRSKQACIGPIGQGTAELLHEGKRRSCKNRPGKMEVVPRPNRPGGRANCPASAHPLLSELRRESGRPPAAPGNPGALRERRGPECRSIRGEEKGSGRLVPDAVGSP